MAIRGNKTAVPQEETQPTPAPEVETTQTQAAPPAVKQQAAPPAVVGDKAPSFAQLENLMDPVEYGNTFPRLVPGAAGMIRTDSNIVLGPWVDVQVVSHSYRWMCAPVVDKKEEQEARKYCRASYDGATIPDRDGGASMTFEEWQEQAAEIRKAAKQPVYEEWRVGKYKDIYAMIFNADPKYKDTAVALGIVQVSVSTTAIKGFNAFFMQQQLWVAKQLMRSDKSQCIRIKPIPGVNKAGQDFTILVPDLVPLDVIDAYTIVSVV